MKFENEGKSDGGASENKLSPLERRSIEVLATGGVSREMVKLLLLNLPQESLRTFLRKIDNGEVDLSDEMDIFIKSELLDA